MTKKIHITTDFIRLDTFLKLSGATRSGGEAKYLIQTGNVEVNNVLCLQRTKKLQPGDTVKIDSQDFEVTKSESDETAF